MTTVIVRRRPTGESDLPVPPLLQRIYANRNVTTQTELDKGLDKLPPPALLKGMPDAVQLLVDALRQRARILILADFDADGATSCALALRALTLLGAHDVKYVVPNRFEYGYGLTPEIVDVAARENPQLLVTVDNGISSLQGVDAARALGIKVLITDHHLPAAQLPAADAIVNPNQPDDRFPSKNLAGVGVIFYVMLALRARLRELGWFAEQDIAQPNLGQLLDLVAFGTVADVVPLDHVNRILVEQGLRRIRAGKCSSGITALANVARRNPDRLVAGDIAFALGPRLNAAGRLQDMSFGIQCLLCDDLKQARAMAWRLDKLNHERRAIESEMRAQAETDLQRLTLADKELPFGLCLYDESWHQGVIGILAARIREQTHRPVIVFAPDKDGVIKGSARSVPNLHIRDVLDAVAAANPGLISKFGGHAMAAGMSLPFELFDAFSGAFDAEVRRHLDADDLRGVLYSDGELQAGELCLEVAEVLRAGGPWGQAFPEPLFDGEFEVIDQRIVGARHLKMTVRLVQHDDRVVDAIAFNHGPDIMQTPPTRIRAVYRLDINEWQGHRNAQLVIEYFETCR